ncbi:glycosyltransferase [Entomohabitans teleogrylli]|uniref:glycosyltransferase n=1 Tax=Entomohabitans teleogrylli TaxID=1384589 RepID=UPI0009E83309|nr:glycosyltransferase [Entomohabitans teleogrylli]
MSLSQLLASAYPGAEQLSGNALPSPHPGVVLFFSISSGKERARVHIARGEDFSRAWQEGASALQAWRKKQQHEPIWLRVDVVFQLEALSWAQLRDKLSKTKRNYFRFGLAFDADFHHAMLEQEIAANAVLYQGTQGVATPNDANLAHYGRQRFATELAWPQDDQQTLWRFNTRAVFSDGAACYPIEFRGKNAGYRELENWQQQLPMMIDSATDYLARQVQKSGRYHYGWFPCFDRAIPSYNALRHASSTYALLEGWELTRSPQHFAAIERALQDLCSELIQTRTLPDGSEADFLIDTGDEIKLGGNAVCILAMAKYTELTGDKRYLEQMARLANGIAFMQNPDTGGFVHVLNAGDLSLKAAHRIIYYDGEATFSLMRLYGLTREPRWLAIVERAVDYFIIQKHWQAHDHWLSYCINELTLYRPQERYFRFGLDNVRDYLDFVLQRITTYPTLLELMMAAQRMLTRLAESQHRHLLDGFDIDKFYQALEVRARYLANGFFWPELAMFFKNPARIVGSFFIRHHSFRVRIDDVEHYLSGYVAYSKYLKQNAPAAQRQAAPERQRVVFLCENLRKVGNGIEVAILRRARLFSERLGIVPEIITSVQDPALPGNVAALKASGELPGAVEVRNVWALLNTLRQRELIQPLETAGDAPRAAPGEITHTSEQHEDGARIQTLYNDQGEALARKYYAARLGKNVLTHIELLDPGHGLRRFNSEAAFCAFVLEASLDKQTRWHFVVDKNLAWKEFVCSQPRQRLNVTISAFIHSTHRHPNGSLKGSYAHLINDPLMLDNLLIQTREQHNDLIEEGVPGDRLRVIPNHLDNVLSEAQADRENSTRVLYMARYSPEKQHDLLLRAFAEVVKTLPDAQLHTWGTGPLRAALQEEVNRLGLEKNIFIHGFSTDRLALQRASCCAVLCSSQEGLSLFGLESLSYGTPLVSFAIKYGPRDLLENFAAGRLVAPGDEQALAAALVEVISQPQQQAELRRQALRSAQRYHIDNIEKLWKKWWQSVSGASVNHATDQQPLLVE